MSDEQKPDSIEIGGDVTGKYVNIGGIQTILEAAPHERTCPLPPGMPDKFGGREKPLESLLAKLKAGDDCVITAVRGMGGMGKTTLAKVLANTLHSDKTFRAVLWAEVTRQPDVLLLLRGWAKHADDAFDTANQSEQQIALRVKALLEAVIAEKCQECEPPRVLVVLDDVWEESLKAVEILKTACPDNATILVTTRSGRVANRVAPGDVEALDKMQADDAIKLLREYLGKKPADAVLQTLGLALEGHPLALKLAAYRILDEPERSGETLLTALERCTKEYEKEIPAGTPFAELMLEQGDDKDENLTKSLYHSYEALTPEEQAHFRALGVLPHIVTFDLYILAALWNTPFNRVEQACDALRLRGLIESDERPGWYRQHALLRSLAKNLLAKADETNAVFGQYAEIVTDVAGMFDPLKQEEWRSFDMYLPHIYHTGDELVKQYSANENQELEEYIGRFVGNAQRYMTRRPEMVDTSTGRKRRGLDWLETGLMVYRRQGLRNEEAITLNNIGRMWNDLGEKRTALQYYEESLALSKEIGNKTGESTTLLNIGHIWNTLGDKQKALDSFHQALVIEQELDDKRGIAAALASIGGIWREQGENYKALDYFDRSLILMREINDKVGEATALNNIGGVWKEWENLNKALKYFEQSLVLRHTTGDKLGEATTLNNIGGLWSAFGNDAKALEYHEKSLVLRRMAGDKAGEANSLNNIATVYVRSGELQRAKEIYEQIIHILQKIGAVSEEATLRDNLATVLQKLNRIEEAIVQIRQAIEIMRKYNLVQSAGGGTLADMEIFLLELQVKLQPETRNNNRRQLIMDAFRQGDRDEVRKLNAQISPPSDKSDDTET